MFNADDIISKLKRSGLNGVAIARGAIGNPWLFKQLTDTLTANNPNTPALAEQGEIILEHFQMLKGIFDEAKSVRYFRKFLAGYCKNHPERKKVQSHLMAISGGDELAQAVKLWYQQF